MFRVSKPVSTSSGKALLSVLYEQLSQAYLQGVCLSPDLTAFSHHGSEVQYHILHQSSAPALAVFSLAHCFSFHFICLNFFSWIFISAISLFFSLSDVSFLFFSLWEGTWGRTCTCWWTALSCSWSFARRWPNASSDSQKSPLQRERHTVFPTGGFCGVCFDVTYRHVHLGSLQNSFQKHSGALLP